jgi:hypothetical protein
MIRLIHLECKAIALSKILILVQTCRTIKKVTVLLKLKIGYLGDVHLEFLHECDTQQERHVWG